MYESAVIMTSMSFLCVWGGGGGWRESGGGGEKLKI